MANSMDLLGNFLGQGALQRMAGQLGTDPQTTAKAVQVALPSLLAGLTRQTRDPQGAQGLFEALRRDHDGSILAEDPTRFDRHPQAQKGGRILEHTLGAKQPAVVDGVSRATGLDRSKVLMLLAMLAPLVMGALGRARQNRGVQEPAGLGGLLGDLLGGLLGGGAMAGAGGTGGVGGMGLPGLGTPEPRSAPAQRTGQRAGGLGGILDSDNDGQIADDIARMGAQVLGGGGLGGLFGGGSGRR